MADPLITLIELRSGPETLLRRVRHAVSDQRFLVKSVAPAAAPASADRIAAKLRREYDFAASMTHNRILRPRDWDPTIPAITYDDAQGTLAQLVRQEGKLDPPVVARVLYQCLEALAYLHGQGYGHGGLTADGVFVTPDGDVALGDFVGYRLDRRGGGVPIWPEYPLWYRAPELIDISLEERLSDKERQQGSAPAVRTDLYSLGYLALQLLCPEAEFLRLFGLDPSFNLADANWDGWHGDLARPAPKLDDVLYDVPVGLREVLQPLVLKDPGSRCRLSIQHVRDAIDRLGLMSGKKLPAIGRKMTKDKVEPESTPVERGRNALSDPTKHDRFILQLRATDGSSRVFPASQSVVVGSAKGADLHIPHPSVTARHAILIHRGASGWWVYDTRSNAAGTKVDGASAENGAAVRTNRVVTFGTIALTASIHRGFWFGPFLVAARLYGGSNGIVYRAIWSEKANGEVAVRVFPTTFQANNDAIRRFFRSIPEAGKFRHPNIVSLYKGGFRRSREHGRIWYLVMRFMPGGSLRERLRKGRLPAAEAVQIGRDITAALKAIGERGDDPPQHQSLVHPVRCRRHRAAGRLLTVPQRGIGNLPESDPRRRRPPDRPRLPGAGTDHGQRHRDVARRSIRVGRVSIRSRHRTTRGGDRRPGLAANLDIDFERPGPVGYVAEPGRPGGARHLAATRSNQEARRTIRDAGLPTEGVRQSLPVIHARY